MPYNDEVVINFWDGSTTNYSGSTPFGYFDNDTALATDAPKLAKMIATHLGYPVNDIEITSDMIYAGIEQSLIDYSHLIHEYNIKENYFDVMGQPTSSNFSNILVSPNLSFALKISDAYALETDAGGIVDARTGSIDVVAGQQVYNIKTAYFDVHHPNEKSFVVRRVFHNFLPAIRSLAENTILPAVGIPHGIINGFSPNDSTGFGSQTLLPLSWDVMRAQSIKMSRDIRMSDTSFEFIGNTLRLFPIPKRNYKLWFHYTIESDAVNALNNLNNLDSINSPHKMNYDFIQWSSITPTHKAWIIKYAIAQCTFLMGRVRRKFASLPYPNGEVSLDGDALVSEGQASMESLTEQLKNSLQELSKERGFEIKRNIIDNQKFMLNQMPLGIYKI
jgi:hypothetical protein